MSALGAVSIHDVDDETGDETDRVIARTKPASPAAVSAVVNDMDPLLSDGYTRSEWLWVRLSNGDLILGVFPQADGYFAFEDEASF